MATAARERAIERCAAMLRRVNWAALAHPAWWAWPAAAVLVWRAPRRPDLAETALRWYLLPALLLVFVGCLPSLRGSTARALWRPTFVPRGLLVWLTIAVLTGAVAVRLWRLSEWPPQGIGFEEYELAARADLPGSPLDNLVTIYAHPLEHALTAYAMSLSFTYLGPGFFSMRLPFVLGGIVCPFLFYLLCRRLVAWEPALFALALFAVSWWHIAGSRPADEIFFPLWVEIAVLWLLVCFADTAETWAAFALALGSGVLIYEYTAYHLVMPLVAAYLVVRATAYIVRVLRDPEPWSERRYALLDAIRAYAPGAVAILLVWIIVARVQLFNDVRLGMGSWLLEGVRRHGTSGVLGQLHTAAEFAAFFDDRVVGAVRAFYQPFNGEERFFGFSTYAAFDPVTAVAIGFGAVLVAITPWRRLHLFVLAWAAIIVLGAALLPGNLNPQRYYVALPLFFLLIALGAQVLWDWLSWPLTRALLVAAFAAAIAIAAVINLQRFFWQVVPDRDLRDHWIWPRTEIARWVRDRPRDEPVCIVATDENPGITGPNPLRPEWLWLVKGWTLRIAPTVDGCLPNRDNNGKPARYIVVAIPDAGDALATLRRGYPEVRELSPIRVPYHHFVARTFVVPRPNASG